MSMKLLIVEDNSQMRQLIGSVVADLVEAIVECCDGEEAITDYPDGRDTVSLKTSLGTVTRSGGWACPTRQTTGPPAQGRSERGRGHAGYLSLKLADGTDHLAKFRFK